MYQIYVEIWEATKSSRKVLIYRMYWQLKIYAWIFLITLGCYVVLNTENEIKAMSTIELENANFAIARDIFIFGCWTGISFVDIKNLTTDNIVELNGSRWIVSKRQKTGVPFQIKLMDIPAQIIERNKPFRNGKNLFNINSYDMVNRRIKTVAKMCGIEKNISFHLSWHSFAVLALNYGMPIESVSKILGHTNITTTQIYAKVTNTKLENDISAFEDKVSGHFTI